MMLLPESECANGGCREKHDRQHHEPRKQSGPKPVRRDGPLCDALSLSRSLGYTACRAFIARAAALVLQERVQAIHLVEILDKTIFLEPARRG
jgi:hypothetical protein